MYISLITTLIFIVSIYLMPFCVSLFRQNKNLIIVYFLIISIYQIVAFINAFWFRTIGADMDANSFHVIGVNISEAGIFVFHSDASLYKNILGFLYWITEPSHIIGEQLSILSISISIIFFVKILDILELNYYHASMVALYAGLPTMFMLGAITLREPLQLSLLIVSVYFGLKMRVSSENKLINFIFLLLFSFASGLFHKGIFVFAIILIFLFLVWDVSDIRDIKRKYTINKYRLLTLALTPFLIFVFFYLASNSDITGAEIYRKLLNLDFLESIANHRTYTPIGRASYNITFDYSSFLMLLYSSFLIYINYLFSPFPWQISSIPDFYAMSEALLHLILIYYSIKLLIRKSAQKHKLLVLMLIFFFFITLIYSFGTTNYGTGVRHKMLSWWLIVLTGGPLLFESLSIFIKKVNSNV